MNSYIIVLILIIFSVILALIMSGISSFIGPNNRKTEDLNYECGIPSGGPFKGKMSVKFYLTAILFLLFDIETVYLYLWARSFHILGWLGIIEVFIFVFILLAGYIYIVKSGALEWDK